jgi:hypothetical protein
MKCSFRPSIRNIWSSITVTLASWASPFNYLSPTLASGADASGRAWQTPSLSILTDFPPKKPRVCPRYATAVSSESDLFDGSQA